MTKRQRLISAALCDRLPAVTHKGYMAWYADKAVMIRESNMPNRILSARAAAVGYIYAVLGIIPLPMKGVKGWPEQCKLGDTLTNSDMESLLMNLGVVT